MNVLSSLRPALLPLALAVCATAPAPDAWSQDGAEPDRVQILGEIGQYYQDFSSRDWEAFASHFWEGATITTRFDPDGGEAVRVVVTGVPEFVAKAPEGPGSKPIFEEVMTSSKILLYGNLAVAWAGYDAKFGEEGDLFEWSGVDAFTLMKHEGRWKITSLAFHAEHE